MSTLYLHIGTPKTGTSAIQYFMAANRKILNSIGYCYPDLGIDFPGIGENRNAHFLVYKIYDQKKRLVEKEKELVEETLNKIVKIAEEYPNIILSDEGIWNGASKKKDFWAELKNQLDQRNINLKVIVYLRRQDLLIQSFWAQQVKEISTVSFKRYIDDKKYKEFDLDYYGHIDHIAQAAGQENLIVRVYESSQFSGEAHTIVSDFMETIGLEFTTEYCNTDKVYNLSLTGRCLEVKRLLNYMPEFQSKLNFSVPLLTQVQKNQEHTINFQECQYFSAEEQTSFLKQFEQGNDTIARDYLKREDGVLFKEPYATCDGTQSITFRPEELVGVCGEIIMMQKQECDNLKEELEDSYKRIAEMNKKLRIAEERIMIKIGKNIKKALKKLFC
jgi:hypothetical protein